MILITDGDFVGNRDAWALWRNSLRHALDVDREWRVDAGSQLVGWDGANEPMPWADRVLANTACI